MPIDVISDLATRVLLVIAGWHSDCNSAGKRQLRGADCGRRQQPDRRRPRRIPQPHFRESVGRREAHHVRRSGRKQRSHWNFVGLNRTGTAAIPNRLMGLRVDGGGNLLRGNVVSGNRSSGIYLVAGNTGTQISGNLLGTDATDSFAIPNARYGVDIVSSGGNLVGGPDRPDLNVISGNIRDGVRIFDASVPNQVVGNYIGTNAAGNKALSSGLSGVLIDKEGNHLVEGNVVSGNARSGIELIGGTR